MKPPTALFLIALLTACGPPNPEGKGQFEGPPPFMPSYPDGDGTKFYEEPSCLGDAWIAGDGEPYAYSSVLYENGDCSGETGQGYGQRAQ